MRFTKTAKSIVAALLCAGMLSGCAGVNPDSSESTSGAGSTSSSAESTSGTAQAPAENSGDAESETTPQSAESDTTGEESVPQDGAEPDAINVLALKGPTAMGMTKLMDDDEANGYPYEFTISAAVDEISPKIIQGTADIVCVPANLGSVLYNKTEGGVQVLALNTLGVLYICENGSTVTSVADLKGKTIFASGKGATPEYALNYILKGNGIDPESDVTIEWKSEHAECVSALLTTENSVALLPQPFVTTAQTKNEGINAALDLTKEWDALGTDSAMITGAVIVRTEFAQQYPQAVDTFLERYAQSVKYVTENVEEGAKLVGKYDIVPEAVALKAIPACNIVCITGSEMKEKLSGYLNVLFEQLPASVGGALPADDFYYGA